MSALSFTCHFNLLPIRASLKNPSRACMLGVIRLALAVCAAIYGTVAVSGEARPEPADSLVTLFCRTIGTSRAVHCWGGYPASKPGRSVSRGDRQ